MPELAKMFDFEPFFFKPAIGIEWQSDDMVDYYYGVKPSEATSYRAAYSGDDALNIPVTLDFYMGLSEEWLLVTSFKFNFLDDEITDSSIVEEDFTFTSIIAITRMF